MLNRVILCQRDTTTCPCWIQECNLVMAPEQRKCDELSKSSIRNIVFNEAVIFPLLFSIAERPDQQIRTSIGGMCVNPYRLSASAARISTLR